MDRNAGAHLIAGTRSGAPDASFRAVDPRSGRAFGPSFPEADASDVDEAVQQAAATSATVADTPLTQREALLRQIADRLESAGEEIVRIADHETALGLARLEGELRRTCGQLRLFADIVAEGSFLDVAIDTATETTPDLRRFLVPLGPVGVFGASNFPLAFSVAGGDTASALAAGCPVVVKAHPSHPATSQRCGEEVVEAVASSGFPAGVFSLLHAREVASAQHLVRADGLTAIAFTGSLQAGRAIFDVAAGRAVPIPVYAEMGSLNPMVITPEAAGRRAASLADTFVSSMTLGVGQFCTKPGLLFVPDTEGGRRVEAGIADAVRTSTLGCLLSTGVRDRLDRGTACLEATTGVDRLAQGLEAPDGITYPAEVFVTRTDVLLTASGLLEEQFGPVAVLVRYGSLDELEQALARLPGSLTATIHAEPSEGETRARVQRVLLARVGRVIHDGVPTGVAVSHAMHHGGPYPATTSPLHTSVGSAAVRRFLRPVALQDAPADVVPPQARDDNPLGIWRRVDGELTRSPLG